MLPRESSQHVYLLIPREQIFRFAVFAIGGGYAHMQPTRGLLQHWWAKGHDATAMISPCGNPTLRFRRLESEFWQSTENKPPPAAVEAYNVL